MCFSHLKGRIHFNLQLPAIAKKKSTTCVNIANFLKIYQYEFVIILYCIASFCTLPAVTPLTGFLCMFLTHSNCYYKRKSFHDISLKMNQPSSQSCKRKITYKQEKSYPSVIICRFLVRINESGVW